MAIQSGQEALISRAPNSCGYVQPGHWFDPAARTITSEAAVLDRTLQQDVVLLGEQHDLIEHHLWQLRMVAAFHARGASCVVGMEMLPRSVQPALDRWIAGLTDVDAFLEESQWWVHWGFDPDLYLPIFRFCRQAQIPIVALNCYRALVTRVRQEGWAAIPEAARDGLTPSAPATDAYRRYLRDIMTGFGRSETPMEDMDFDGFVDAQQVWDRAFAENIVRAQADFPGRLIVGIIGRGHLEFGHGTPYQLRDLGVGNMAVLLTGHCDSRGRRIAEDLFPAGLCDAVFCLDERNSGVGPWCKTGIRFSTTMPVTVSAIADNSPAAMAGVCVGDVVRGLCGAPVASHSDARQICGRLPYGIHVPVDLERDRKPLSLTLSLPANGVTVQ